MRGAVFRSAPALWHGRGAHWERGEGLERLAEELKEAMHEKNPAEQESLTDVLTDIRYDLEA